MESDECLYREQDPYLSKHRGEYAERNAGAVAPFANQLDLSVSHDIKDLPEEWSLTYFALLVSISLTS